MSLKMYFMFDLARFFFSQTRIALWKRNTALFSGIHLGSLTIGPALT